MAAGYYTYRGLPIDAFPDVSPNLVQVFTITEGLAPEEIEQYVTYPIETAMGYEKLIDLFSYSHKKVGKRVVKSRTTISNLLRLLKLPKQIRDWLTDGTLTTCHARALLALETEPKRLRTLSEEVVAKELSVRQTEALIREGMEKKKAGPKKQPKPGRRQDPVIREMEERLATTLASKVTITHTRGRGKVILEYNTPGELEALSDRLMKG